MSSRLNVDRDLARREAARQFLMERIDYERTQSMPCSEEAMKLDRMRELLRLLDNPETGLPIIHVAGTKGKGSTSAMMAAVLSAAGYRTGLFTSPHLDRVEERMAIDGQPCSAEDLVELVELVQPQVAVLDQAAKKGTGPICAQPGTDRRLVAGRSGKLDLTPFSPAQAAEHGPTYFEIITAMALCHFARRGAKAAVLEVGLGGRLDSTNVCMPCVSVITSISFDHTKQLGETLSAIAAEKGGIIKPGVPVVSGVLADEPREVIRAIARRGGCRLQELGVDFDFEYRPPRHLERAASPGCVTFTRPQAAVAPQGATADRGFALGLVGRHQAANAAVVLAVVEELRGAGWTIPEAAVRRGLAEVVWPARVEVVARRPAVVLDAAHNAASIAALVEVLDESFSARQRWLIFATTQEKDLRGMLGQLLGRFDRIIFTRYLNNPRSVPPEQLLALAEELCAPGPQVGGRDASGTPEMEIAPDPADAWDAVRRVAEADDLICITGSFFLAAEMRRQLAERPFPPSSTA